ncbi:MAG: NDP-sugar synthase [Myxococcales bacterium]|nr:NDP-sugar synthase [Myxococcales bacterium]
MPGLRGMLVAAGFGTRLRPLTDELPKPAVPVANRPLGTYALSHLAAAGVRDLVINTHHLAQALRRSFEPHVGVLTSTGGGVAYVHEPRILGTGGGVKNAWRPPREGPFVVMNAKLLFAPDVAQLLAVHTASDALVTLVVRPMPPFAKFGPVDVDDEGRVRAVLAEPRNPSLQRCMFTGVYALSPRAHALLPDQGCLFRNGIVAWLAAGERVMAVIDSGPFADVGQSLDHYHAANMDLVSGRRTWPGVQPDPETEVLMGARAQVDPRACLRRCVVGSGARVGPVRLEDTVLWPGASVDRDLTAAIVTGTGRIVSVGQGSNEDA